jgi:hypothetical protein
MASTPAYKLHTLKCWSGLSQQYLDILHPPNMHPDTYKKNACWGEYTQKNPNMPIKIKQKHINPYKGTAS